LLDLRIFQNILKKTFILHFNNISLEFKNQLSSVFLLCKHEPRLSHSNFFYAHIYKKLAFSRCKRNQQIKDHIISPRHYLHRLYGYIEFLVQAFCLKNVKKLFILKFIKKHQFHASVHNQRFINCSVSIRCHKNLIVVF